MTCPFCLVALITIFRQGLSTLQWRACPCCGCMWLGRVDRANQVHPLAWVPACHHPVPAWATT